MIVLIIFGAGKLPQLGEGVGKAIKGFKKSVQEAEAYDVDPTAQGENTASTAPLSASPQISQPMDTGSGAMDTQTHPEAVHSGQEHAAVPSKV